MTNPTQSLIEEFEKEFKGMLNLVETYADTSERENVSRFFDTHLPPLLDQARKEGIEEGREEYRDHLRFLYRWISRLNGDKEHDRPETEWKTYLAAMVNYPLSPWETGDWFEEARTPSVGS